MPTNQKTEANKDGLTSGLAVGAGFGEGCAIERITRPTEHATKRRNDLRGIVLKTKDDPTTGLLLLVRHDGRASPIWWAASHWKLSSPP